MWYLLDKELEAKTTAWNQKIMEENSLFEKLLCHATRRYALAAFRNQPVSINEVPVQWDLSYVPVILDCHSTGRSQAVVILHLDF